MGICFRTIGVGLSVVAMWTAACMAGEQKRDPMGEAIVLQTSSARLVIRPEIGRITELSRPGGPNMLWLNPEQKERPRSPKTTWGNWGGDKVWPSWQSAWPKVMGRGWPPDEVFDGGNFKVLERSERKVVIESGVSPYLNVRLVREIELAADVPKVTIRNTLARTADSPHPVHIWSVSQVPVAEYYLLGLRPFQAGTKPPWMSFSEKPEEFERFLSLAGPAGKYDPPRDRSTKVGAFGDWVAGVYERDVFLQISRFEPGGDYPDRSNVQVYTDKPYAELETLSPQKRLAAGESMSNSVVWLLVERRANETPEGLASRLNRLATELLK